MSCLINVFVLFYFARGSVRFGPSRLEETPARFGSGPFRFWSGPASVLVRALPFKQFELHAVADYVCVHSRTAATVCKSPGINN